MRLDDQQKALIKYRLQNTVDYLKENDIADYTNVDLDELVNQDFQGAPLILMMMMLHKEGLIE